MGLPGQVRDIQVRALGPGVTRPAPIQNAPLIFCLLEGQRKVWPWPQFHLSLSVIEPNSQVP